MSDDPAAAVSHFPPPNHASPPLRQTVFREISGRSNELELTVAVELGRVRMRLADVLNIRSGAKSFCHTSSPESV